MAELEVVEVRTGEDGVSSLVILRVRATDLLLPIWTTPAGAGAILGAAEEPDADRPGIHDLVVSLLAGVGESLQQVRLVGYHEGQYFADLMLADGTAVPARASDAIALALRTGTTITCTDELVELAGVRSGSWAAGGDAEVERFRAFLDEVNPDDFDSGNPEGPVQGW